MSRWLIQIASIQNSRGPFFMWSKFSSMRKRLWLTVTAFPLTLIDSSSLRRKASGSHWYDIAVYSGQRASSRQNASKLQQSVGLLFRSTESKRMCALSGLRGEYSWSAGTIVMVLNATKLKDVCHSLKCVGRWSAQIDGQHIVRGISRCVNKAQ